jgi:fluoride exporter
MKGLVIELTLIAIGAVAGALLRYRITSSPLLLLDALPVSVLIVNAIGSFILGVFSVLAVAWNLDSKYSLLVAVGFCGSLTTMSSFALETVRLLDERLFGKMALNLIVNVGFSIGAIIAGRQLVNTLMILRDGGGLL